MGWCEGEYPWWISINRAIMLTGIRIKYRMLNETVLNVDALTSEQSSKVGDEHQGNIEHHHRHSYISKEMLQFWVSAIL
jgi:uncharacterized protein YfkK (UPF0435 family)